MVTLVQASYMRYVLRAVALTALLTTPSCTPFMGAYLSHSLRNAQVHRDLAYLTDAHVKHQLDFFVPDRSGFPILVFAHGGGWTSGDKNDLLLGHDAYQNFGRYFAANGIGVALINYRLQPTVRLSDQIYDVAAAVAWLHRHGTWYGADVQLLFLIGHSAGGQLVAHVAYDARHLRHHGLPPATISGAVIISAAALDLRPVVKGRASQGARAPLSTTEEPGACVKSVKHPRPKAIAYLSDFWIDLIQLLQPAYYESRFDDGSPEWHHYASPVAYISSTAPPTLVVNAENDPPSLRRQGELLHCRLAQHAVVTSHEVIAEENHFSLLNALSRDSDLTTAIRRFVVRLGFAAGDRLGTSD